MTTAREDSVQFKGGTVKVSSHALRRIVERWGNSPPKNPLKAIENLLKSSRQVQLPIHRESQRIISNGFKHADYYESSGFRFVVCDGTLVTVERVK